MLKIDVFNHIVPPRYAEAVYKELKVKNPKNPKQNLELRMRVLERFEGYVQILDIGSPSLEDVKNPDAAIKLAQMANDEMAELVDTYPDKFIAATACLPLQDIDASLAEIDRVITKLKFRSVRIPTTIFNKSLDQPEFEPIFKKMAYYNLPIKIHPQSTTAGTRAYSINDKNKTPEFYAQREINWCYETSIAMGCIVFSGLLKKYPNLKLVTHHCGGVLPFQSHRIGRILEYGAIAGNCVDRNPMDYYKMFYGDTVMYNNTAALMCGYSFFGADHMMFATDMPLGASGGDRVIRDTIKAVEDMDITVAEKAKIFEGNALEIFRLPPR